LLRGLIGGRVIARRRDFETEVEPFVKRVAGIAHLVSRIITNLSAYRAAGREVADKETRHTHPSGRASHRTNWPKSALPALETGTLQTLAVLMARNLSPTLLDD
jgi:hypothetical protein